MTKTTDWDDHRASFFALESELHAARRQLGAVQASRTWKVGRAVVGPAARLRAAVLRRPAPRPTVHRAGRPKPAQYAVDLYLDLLKRTLLRLDLPEPFRPYEPPVGTSLESDWKRVRDQLPTGVALLRSEPFDRRKRIVGKDWPAQAESMVGLRRLDNVQHCVEQALLDHIPGDLMETGVWRGGAAILMRALLAVYGDPRRQVWAADSFQGLPHPDITGYEQDAGDRHWTRGELAVSRSEVEKNFARYGLLDDRVRFLEGWFHETLPAAPVKRISVLRLDGDMYGSTMTSLQYLYPKVSPGGFVIVDDYGAIESCRRAVADYRDERQITTPIEQIDWTGVFWRKP